MTTIDVYDFSGHLTRIFNDSGNFGEIFETDFSLSVSEFSSFSFKCEKSFLSKIGEINNHILIISDDSGIISAVKISRIEEVSSKETQVFCEEILSILNDIVSPAFTADSLDSYLLNLKNVYDNMFFGVSTWNKWIYRLDFVVPESTHPSRPSLIREPNLNPFGTATEFLREILNSCGEKAKFSTKYDYINVDGVRRIECDVVIFNDYYGEVNQSFSFSKNIIEEKKITDVSNSVTDIFVTGKDGITLDNSDASFNYPDPFTGPYTFVKKGKHLYCVQLRNQFNKKEILISSEIETVNELYDFAKKTLYSYAGKKYTSNERKIIDNPMRGEDHVRIGKKINGNYVINSISYSLESPEKMQIELEEL